MSARALAVGTEVGSWTRRSSNERSTVERSLEGVATPARLRAALRGRVLDTRGLLAELGIHCSKAGLAAAAQWLRTHGCKKTLVGGRNAWEWVGLEERAAAGALPSGPCLEVGAGEKRECCRYEGCLVAFLRAHPNSTSARCPSACAHFVPPERSRLLRKACDDVSYAQRGANLGGVA